jgi:Co/Zn/Cd efflux system component
MKNADVFAGNWGKSPRISFVTLCPQVEVIVGHVTGSMALVADAFHMLSDIVALVIAFISIVMSPKTW